MMSSATPRIFQINVSNGGVPKLAVLHADVMQLGITTDTQRNLKHHGGPDRALCLYTLEHILSLQEEGHPIFPGAAGENITTIGLDLGSLELGARLRLGEVEIELTSYTVPCKNISPFFSDGDSNRISQKLHPGWSRVYARILREGKLRIGDAVTILG
jgi:MOSC domain-containing protein YiiM